MKHSKNNLVSIIMPNYNCSRFIGRAIESVLAQTHTNWELLIVDDKSTDDSVKVIRPYLKDKRIKLSINKKNCGAVCSRNKSLKAAKGRYIAFLDSDDAWHPQKLQKQLCFMADTGIPLAYSFYEVVDENGKFIRLRRPKNRIRYHDILRHHRIPNLTAIYDTQRLNKVLQIECRHCQDYRYWLKILKQGHEAACVPEVLAYYTKRNRSISSNKWQMAKTVWHILRTSEGQNVFLASLYFFQYFIFGVFNHFRRW